MVLSKLFVSLLKIRMVISLPSQVPLLFYSLFFLLLSPPCNADNILRSCKFDGIYQLGDSISDTGNRIREVPFPPCATFFNNATGRCSNGLFIIDFLASSAGIPFLEPYLNRDTVFSHGRGVNFAVAGATALPVEILAKNGVATVTNTSLTGQLDWMFTHFNAICVDEEDCFKKLKTALFMVGEIGGNDYNFALLQGKSFDQVRSLAPLVIQAIKDAVTRVVGYGATRVIVPGNFPIGCLPIYLTLFRSNNFDAYDGYRCLKDLNDLSIHHNSLLKQAIKEMRKQLPDAIIVYGDYYNAYMELLNKPRFLGFDPYSTQKACCGIGGDYNFNMKTKCGDAGVAVCQNPDQYISWDGVHMTQSAYKFITRRLLDHVHRKLRCGV